VIIPIMCLLAVVAFGALAIAVLTLESDPMHKWLCPYCKRRRGDGTE
jgi:hypothetical protein